MKNFKIFTLLFALLALLICSACPGKLTIEKAKRESARVATGTFELTNAVRTLFRENKISAETTVRLSERIIAFSRVGQSFDKLIAEYERIYRTVDRVPPAEWQKALKLFNSMVDELVGVLIELKAIDADEQTKLAINTLILSIRLIARAFSIEKPIAARIAEAQKTQ